MTARQNRLQLGQKGETIAVEYLKQNGYEIHQRNVRTKLGEIDIVAAQAEYLVFVEVKSRYESKMEIHPFISMTQSKRNRIRLLGKNYLANNNIRSLQPRFDVIGIIFKNDQHYSLEHVKNAF